VENKTVNLCISYYRVAAENRSSIRLNTIIDLILMNAATYCRDN